MSLLLILFYETLNTDMFLFEQDIAAIQPIVDQGLVDLVESIVH